MLDNISYLFVVVNDDKFVTVMRTGDKTGASFHSGGSDVGSVRKNETVARTFSVRGRSWFLSMKMMQTLCKVSLSVWYVVCCRVSIAFKLSFHFYINFI